MTISLFIFIYIKFFIYFYFPYHDKARKCAHCSSKLKIRGSAQQTVRPRGLTEIPVVLVSNRAPLIRRRDQTKHEIHPHRPLAPASPSGQQWRRDPGEPTSRPASQPARTGSPMACLVPQFMWVPSAAAHGPSSSSRCCALRVHCAVTSAAAVVDADCANGGGAAHLRLTYAAPALQVTRSAWLDCLSRLHHFYSVFLCFNLYSA